MKHVEKLNKEKAGFACTFNKADYEIISNTFKIISKKHCFHKGYRMKDPKKNWEFPFNDVMERQYGDRYQEVFKGMFSHTSAEYAP